MNTIYIGSDHAAFTMKSDIIKFLMDMDINIVDCGTHNESRCDYPDYADVVCRKVLTNEGSRGIVICGTGIGISIAANKWDGIRCALCHDEYTAQMSMEHNDANVLAFGARTTTLEAAQSIVKAWLNSKFGGGRHADRVSKLIIKHL